MSPKKRAFPAGRIDNLIREIRGRRVMLDSDLAAIYGVETKALNRAVKRNAYRFPKDFVFPVSPNEWENLKCQIGTSSFSHGGRRGRPYVFTEHGAIMAANVLNSRRAVQMSVFVVRAFLKMRALLGDKRELAPNLHHSRRN
jgi:ORF6N domain